MLDTEEQTCCVTVSPVLLAGCIYVCQVAAVWRGQLFRICSSHIKIAHSSSKEGVVKLKARAKPMIQRRRKCFLRWTSNSSKRYFYGEGVSKAWRELSCVSWVLHPPGSAGSSRVLCRDQTHHKQQSHRVSECLGDFYLRILVELKRLRWHFSISQGVFKGIAWHFITVASS